MEVFGRLLCGLIRLGGFSLVYGDDAREGWRDLLKVRAGPPFIRKIEDYRQQSCASTVPIYSDDCGDWAYLAKGSLEYGKYGPTRGAPHGRSIRSTNTIFSLADPDNHSPEQLLGLLDTYRRPSLTK